MSDSWIMGQLAAQDRYDPEEGTYQADLLRAQQPSRDPRLDPGLRRTPGDISMMPAAQAFGEVVGNAVIPQDPLDYAAMFALGPAGKLASKGVRAGALAMGGVLGLSDEAEAGKLDLIKKGIKAYHSSPHDFEKFDAGKIGTGEGAQVYGHGLYFAENPKVSGQGGEYWNQFTRKFEGPEYLAADKLKKSGFDRDVAAASSQWEVRELEDLLKRGVQPPGLQGGPFDEHTLRSITKNMLYEKQAELDLLRSNKPVGPRTYEVNIRADPGQMLDWDKPLKAQDKAVQEAIIREAGRFTPSGPVAASLNRELRTGNVEPFSGQSAYSAIGGLGGDRRAASRALQEAGIPGIKYLDQGSRGRVNALEAFGQKPTSNYVVFDPSIVDIMKKYGIAGAVAPMGALAAQDEYR